mgnify:FL=1
MNNTPLIPIVLTALSVLLLGSILVAFYFWRRLASLEILSSRQRIESQTKLERAVQVAIDDERYRAREAQQQAVQRFTQAF